MRNRSFARWSLGFGAALTVGGILLGFQGSDVSIARHDYSCGSVFVKADYFNYDDYIATDCESQRESHVLFVEVIGILGFAFLAGGVFADDRRLYALSRYEEFVGAPGSGYEPE